MRQTHISFRQTRTQRYERDQRRGQQSCQSDDRRELKERDSARNAGISANALGKTQVEAKRHYTRTAFPLRFVSR